MLEPYEGKLSRTVLRGERDSNVPDLLDKPRDMEQRLGRMKRQGNMNEKVHEYVYVTKETFDSYRFQTLETKQRFISQIMTSKNPARTCEDVSSAALEFAEIKALCAGNPLIQEKMELDIEVAKLQTLKSAYQNQRYRTEDDVLKHIPAKLAKTKEMLEAAVRDSKTVSEHPIKYNSDGSVLFAGMTVNGELYTDKKDAGEALLNAAGKALIGNKDKYVYIGDYRGFRLETFEISTTCDSTHVIISLAFIISPHHNILE